MAIGTVIWTGDIRFDVDIKKNNYSNRARANHAELKKIIRLQIEISQHVIFVWLPHFIHVLDIHKQYTRTCLRAF